MSGKGDDRRPAQVSRETFAENYRRTFGDGAKSHPTPPEGEETGPPERVRDLGDPAYTPRRHRRGGAVLEALALVVVCYLFPVPMAVILGTMAAVLAIGGAVDLVAASRRRWGSP